jgi:hypothetical protein
VVNFSLRFLMHLVELKDEKYIMNRKKYEDGGEAKVLSKIPEDLRPYAVLFAQIPEILK